MNNKEKKTHSMKARGMISDVIVHVVLALLAIVWVIPVLWIALLSFSTQKGSYLEIHLVEKLKEKIYVSFEDLNAEIKK